MKRHLLISLLVFCCAALNAVPARRMHKKDFLRPPKAVCHVTQQKMVGTRVLPANIPVILAEFDDLSFDSLNNIASFDSLFNSDNYRYNNATGSVRQYFTDQSYSKYSPHFDIVGKVKLSESVTYYGENKSNGNDKYAGAMVAEACTLADTVLGVDFSKYDGDNDGYVDAVYVLYAGYGEADGGKDYTVWPHNWTISAAGATSPTIDGKIVSVYVCSNELYNEYWDREIDIREGIGLICHEFSHVLGLPDIYTTNGASHKTSGYWDVMDSGAYNNDSRTPPAYSSYERFFMGWTTPVILNEANTIDITNINTDGECYLISEDGTHNLNGVRPSPTDFYLIENRQQQGWDKYLPGAGMMITKINYSYAKWVGNTVNNSKSAMGIDIIEADGKAPANTGEDSDFYGKSTDLFPAGSNNFTPYENYPITNIEQENGIVRFRFMGGKTIDEDTYFSVIFDMENATAVGIDSVKTGTDYTAQLIPDKGYYIDDVAITMGFTDLMEGTDYTLENNTLTIYNVQDDLYILAIAIKDQTTDNQDICNIKIDIGQHYINISANNEELHISVFDILGQVVESVTFINNYNLSLAQGLYFVAITDKNRQTITKKIIIK